MENHSSLSDIDQPMQSFPILKPKLFLTKLSARYGQNAKDWHTHQHNTHKTWIIGGT
jgi:hypothetical protein